MSGGEELAVVAQVLEAADHLLVVRRLADHRDPGVLQLGGKSGDGLGGGPLVAKPLGDVGGVSPLWRQSPGP